ncbi:MAG TPA: hypothetical protein VFZ68_03410 [Acidimicrobiales bacterium]
MTAVPPTTAGAVYDRGYRPYAGPRGGRREARAALWRLSLRRALGLRRSWRQKVLPWSLLGVTSLPAIVQVGVAWAIRNDSEAFADFSFTTYREYIGVSTALLLFVAVTAPDVVCPDRAHRVLPLIFSRPLTGVDYVAAKVAAVATIVFGFAFLPQVVLFVGQMLVSDGALEYLVDNAAVLWQVPAAAAVLALYFAAIAVGVASLTDRRIVAGVALLGLMLVTAAVAAVLTGVAGDEGTPLAVANLLALPLLVRDLIFLGHIHEDAMVSGVAGAGTLAVTAYLVVVGSALAVLLHRYRAVDL